MSNYRRARFLRSGLPKRISELAGKLAVVRRRMVTRSGTIFVKGDRLIVAWTSRGKIHLRDPEDGGRFIRGAALDDVYFPECGEEA